MPSKKGHNYTVYTEEFRKSVVEESEKLVREGKFSSISEYAQSRGIPPATLFVWRHKTGRFLYHQSPKKLVENKKEELIRSGTNYITGHDYMEHVDSIAKSLRSVEHIIRVFAIIIVITGLFVFLFWYTLPYFIA